MRPIGIDFGTTNSLVAAPSPDGMEVLAGSDGQYITPSVVDFSGESVVVGRAAVENAVKHPDETVFAVKRALGTGIEYEIDGRSYTPVDVASLILQALVDRCEPALGESPEDCVITVPATFSPAERQAVKSAGALAGLTVKRLIPEPTAACLAHGLRKGDDRRVLVFDLGGGTFDISLVEIVNGVFDVVQTNGCPQLGGDDWDRAIVDWLLDKIESNTGTQVSLEQEPIVAEQLFDAANTAKEALSDASTTRLEVPYLHHDDLDRIDYTLSRDRFESLTAGLRTEAFERTDELLNAEGLTRPYRSPRIDDIVLVGGATRMPQIKTGIRDRYNMSPVRKTDPDTTVALGAAAQASLLDDVDLVARGSRRTSLGPTTSSSSRLSRGENRTTLEPAHSDPNEIVLMETIPETISVVGLEGEPGEEILPLLEEGQTIPCENSQALTNGTASWRTFEITITQGDPEKPVDDIEMERFRVGPLPALGESENQVEVTASIDVNGLLTITAESAHGDAYSEVVLDGALTVSGSANPMENSLDDPELEARRKELPEVSE